MKWTILIGYKKTTTKKRNVLTKQKEIQSVHVVLQQYDWKKKNSNEALISSIRIITLYKNNNNKNKQTELSIDPENDIVSYFMTINWRSSLIRY